MCGFMLEHKWKKESKNHKKTIIFVPEDNNSHDRTHVQRLTLHTTERLRRMS